MDLMTKVMTWIGIAHTVAWIAYGVALKIPGDHPDKEIKWFYDLTDLLSRKPKG